jgi:hypothetical protein
MDLSEFDKTLNYLPEQVKYFNEDTKKDSFANEVEITWKHKYLPVSELKYYLREGHEAWEDKVKTREQEVLEIWMKELKYNSLHYIVKDKKIVAKGQVETEEQVRNWTKPNSTNILKPKEVDEI